jgi:two-component system LytT family response regulator
VDELRLAVDKVRKSLNKVDIRHIQTLLENVGSLQAAQQKLAVPTAEGLRFVLVSAIIRLEAKSNYTQLFCSDGARILATKTIKEYEELLPDSIFFRTHNSHIINLQKIQKYQKGRGGYVVMEDGASVEIASRRREEFLGKLLK